MIVIYGREKECLIEAGRTEYLEETTKPYDSDSSDSSEDGGSEAENRNETESTGSIGVITDISETPKKKHA